jgi:hypothetical protein
MNLLLERPLTNIDNTFDLVVSTQFKEFERSVLEWYEEACKNTVDGGLPVVTVAELYEHGAESFDPLIYNCIRDWYAKYNIEGAPSDVDKFTEDDHDNIKEYMCQRYLSVDRAFHEDICLYLKMRGFSFRGESHISNGLDICDFENHPVIEVW